MSKVWWGGGKKKIFLLDGFSALVPEMGEPILLVNIRFRQVFFG